MGQIASERNCAFLQGGLQLPFFQWKTTFGEEPDRISGVTEEQIEKRSSWNLRDQKDRNTQSLKPDAPYAKISRTIFP